MKKYTAQATIRDKGSNSTIVQGEECSLQAIEVYKQTSVAVLINSQNNKLEVPFDVFNLLFTATAKQDA